MKGDCENCKYADLLIKDEPCKTCLKIENPPYYMWTPAKENEGSNENV